MGMMSVEHLDILEFILAESRVSEGHSTVSKTV